MIVSRNSRNVSPSISYWFLFTDEMVRISSQCVFDLQTIPRPIMPPACSLLGIATPTPPEMQPFRFFDLPIEIRYMVYEQLMDRCVTVTFPGLELPSCVSEASTEVVDCFYPSLMRTNKQLALEYTSVSSTPLLLSIKWTIDDHDTAREEAQDQAQLPMLPKTVLAILKFSFLSISLDTPTPHCDVQPAIRTLTSRMPELGLFLFTTEYEIDRLVSDTSLADPTEFVKHVDWTDEMMYFLRELVSEENSSWNAAARFHIACALYCLHDRGAEHESVPDTIYAICEGPDEETFKLDGMNLKFMGTDELEAARKAVGDCNVVIPIFPYGDDWQGEE
ncbi:hypothetical protein KCU98_g14155, partial [Aureobasidium melanogenum]